MLQRMKQAHILKGSKKVMPVERKNRSVNIQTGQEGKQRGRERNIPTCFLGGLFGC